jgi:putative salt-induced outer membrane protein
MRNILLLTGALSLALSAPAFAQDAGWSGEAALTGSKTTGNTDTTDVGLGLKLKNDGEVWRHKIRAQADYGESEGTKNKQRFALGYQIDRDITDRLYAFGTADYYNDDFGAYEQGYYVGTGLGYQVVLPDPIGWNVEAGLGFRSQETQGPLSLTEEELAARLKSDFDYALNDNVSFYNDTELTYASSDTYIWNEVGLTAQLFGNLAARASFRVDHHTDVPMGTEKTDTISRVGIVYTMN